MFGDEFIVRTPGSLTSGYDFEVSHLRFFVGG